MIVYYFSQHYIVLLMKVDNLTAVYLEILKIISAKKLVLIEYSSKCIAPRGGTLIFSYICRLGPFFLVQNFEFQYFFGFSKK